MRIRKIGSDRKKKRKPEISESVGFEPESVSIVTERIYKNKFPRKTTSETKTNRIGSFGTINSKQ